MCTVVIYGAGDICTRISNETEPQTICPVCSQKHPIPLRTKVQTELEHMQSLEVISPLHEPTPWCAAMVVAPKDGGAMHIFVDLKPLNECVLREVHPMPKVNTTLARLSGATVFR